MKLYLSWLIGVLDNFDNQKIPAIQNVKPKVNEDNDNSKIDKKGEKSASEPNPFDLDLEGIDDEMAKQLTQGMLQLLQGMDPNDANQFENNLEKIAGDLEKNLNVSDKENKPTTSNKGKKSATTSFQDTISETINNLKNSSDKVEVNIYIFIKIKKKNNKRKIVIQIYIMNFNKLITDKINEYIYT